MTPPPALPKRSLLKEAGLFCLATISNALALTLLAWLLPGFRLASDGTALAAGLVIALLNAAVWPLVARLTLPINVLTLGVGSIVINGILLLLAINLVDGAAVEGFWWALLVVLGMAIWNALAATVLHIEDEQVFDQRTARRAARKRRDSPVENTTGYLLLQVDGLGLDVLRRAMGSGEVPNLSRLVRSGTHKILPWHTEWSSQTGVSQAGLLLGSTDNMPAFRWYEKATDETFVSNHPESAAAIEHAHQVGEGLLGEEGSSYGNLYTGGAGRAVFTMSVVGKRKEGRIGAGYGPYFANPHNVVRTFLGVLADIIGERREAGSQKRRDVQPRVHRGWSYALLRSFTTVVMRDVCVNGVIGDMAEGRPAIYMDFLGYDEVAHHSGIERHDTLAVLRDVDRQIGRIDRARSWSARPYEIVVLSDHGQTQGATFKERYGESLETFVRRYCGLEDGDTEPAEVQTEARGYLGGALSDVDEDSKASGLARSAKKRLRTERPNAPAGSGPAEPIVMASGNLGLIYFPEIPGRATIDEIDARYPGMLEALVAHPGVGFVLVKNDEASSLVLGSAGTLNLRTGDIEGEDPLEPFGPFARSMVEKVDGYENTSDLMVNSIYDPQTDEVAAFEELVGSHGGMGGPQSRAFLLVPIGWQPDGDLIGASAVHSQLLKWMRAEPELASS